MQKIFSFKAGASRFDFLHMLSITGFFAHSRNNWQTSIIDWYRTVNISTRSVTHIYDTTRHHTFCDTCVRHSDGIHHVEKYIGGQFNEKHIHKQKNTIICIRMPLGTTLQLPCRYQCLWCPRWTQLSPTERNHTVSADWCRSSGEKRISTTTA